MKHTAPAQQAAGMRLPKRRPRTLDDSRGQYGYEYGRKGLSTAAIRVFTGDVEQARTFAVLVAQQDYPGCRVYESMARENTLHTVGYSGPAVTVSVKLVQDATHAAAYKCQAGTDGDRCGLAVGHAGACN